MELRDERGAGRGRAAGGRAGVVLLGLALFLAAGALATWPALREADDRFLARYAPGHGQAAAGDHLQVGYSLWLVGHRLARGEAPWRDPYTFQPVAEEPWNLQGWLFGLVYWPFDALGGAVLGWNAFILLSYVLAGGAAAWWLRSLGLPPAAALAGGLAFALAPYRVAQSTGHLLGPVSALLPLALLGIERGRGGAKGWLALAGAALVAIPLSGQLHLALGAIPLVLAYALARTRRRDVLAGAGLGALAAMAAGLAVQRAVISGSVADRGRSLSSVDYYSAEWADFLSRTERGLLEQFVFVGWATPLLALAGFALLLSARRLALAAVLAGAALVPALLALGTNLPLYATAWEWLPPFRFPRVPERLMPIAALALAALLAVAVARVRSPKLAALALLLVAVDLRAGVSLYGTAEADERNAAYAALAREGPGRLLELPVFRPEFHFGSAYQYYAQQAPRERPGGYSSTAPRVSDRLAQSLRGLNCGVWTPAAERLVDGLGIRFVAVHRGLYLQTPWIADDCRAPAERAVAARGRLVAEDGAVRLYALTPPGG